MDTQVQNQTPAWAMDDPKVGMKVLTQKLGEGKIHPDQLPLALDMAKKEFSHVTPQFVMNFLKASKHHRRAEDFKKDAKDIYSQTLMTLDSQAFPARHRLLKLFKICLISGMFMKLEKEKILLEIKKASGLTYHPEESTLHEVSAFISDQGLELAKLW